MEVVDDDVLKLILKQQVEMFSLLQAAMRRLDYIQLRMPDHKDLKISAGTQTQTQTIGNSTQTDSLDKHLTKNSDTTLDKPDLTEKHDETDTTLDKAHLTDNQNNKQHLTKNSDTILDQPDLTEKHDETDTTLDNAHLTDNQNNKQHLTKNSDTTLDNPHLTENQNNTEKTLGEQDLTDNNNYLDMSLDVDFLCDSDGDDNEPSGLLTWTNTETQAQQHADWWQRYTQRFGRQLQQPLQQQQQQPPQQPLQHSTTAVTGHFTTINVQSATDISLQSATTTDISTHSPDITVQSPDITVQYTSTARKSLFHQLNDIRTDFVYFTWFQQRTKLRKKFALCHF